MNDCMVHLETLGGTELVQLTGRVSSSLVEIFRNGSKEWILAKGILSEDRKKLPTSDPDLREKESEIFFIPADRLLFCEDERVQWLANRVWRRLPLFERQVLNELMRNIIDNDRASFAQHYLFSIHSGRGEQKNINGKELPAQIAETVMPAAFLAEARSLESEPAAMFVIAREFAKIILRQPQLFATAGALMDSEPDSFYDEFVIRQLHWAEDHATLQTWLWGFKEEYAAYIKLNPQGCRRNWFTETKRR